MPKIVIDMPDDQDGIQRTGTIIAEQGDHAIVKPFTYVYGQEASDAMHFVGEALDELKALAENPITVGKQAKEVKAKAAQPDPKPKSDDDDTPDWMKPQFRKSKKRK